MTYASVSLKHAGDQAEITPGVTMREMLTLEGSQVGTGAVLIALGLGLALSKTRPKNQPTALSKNARSCESRLQ